MKKQSARTQPKCSLSDSQNPLETVKFDSYSASPPIYLLQSQTSLQSPISNLVLTNSKQYHLPSHLARSPSGTCSSACNYKTPRSSPFTRTHSITCNYALIGQSSLPDRLVM
ncbi:hypothetical protein FGO68_gene10822 [Halteria grandinella]|uniref:Uncharacterized protein n=1 Tax=Halteria grandinella TaxID=5974 RepID=A0A8J8P694_HALGN|nr:hypothetical protein FGO68_gene10822 [Halteria grandinella]